MTTQPYQRKGICGCGAEYEAHDRWQRSCDACVEAKKAFEASRPPRICRKCGAETQEFKSRMCPTCFEEYETKKESERQAGLARDRERRRQQEQKPRNQPEPEPTNQDTYQNRIDTLADAFVLLAYHKATPDKQIWFRNGWRERGYYHLLEIVGFPVEEVEPDSVEPEQVDHEDQVNIDAAFSELLAEMEI